MKNLQTLRKNKKKGFTLVEIIVVLVIIAILMAALAPVMIGWIQEARDTATLAEARSGMVAAQSILADWAMRGSAATPGGAYAAQTGTDPTQYLHTTMTGNDFNSLLGTTLPGTMTVTSNARGDITTFVYTKSGRTATWTAGTPAVADDPNTAADESAAAIPATWVMT